MQIVLGPVVARKGGYAFDCWTSEEGLSRGYTYGRIEDAHYARNVEIRSRSRGSSDQTIACSTVDDFVRLTLDVRGRQQSAWATPLPSGCEPRHRSLLLDRKFKDSPRPAVHVRHLQRPGGS
jgi:hypothetical protein